MTLQKSLIAEGDFLFRYRSYLPLVMIPLLLLSVYFYGSPLFESDPKGDSGGIVGGGAIYNIPLIVTALVVGLLGQTIRTLVAGVVPAGTSIKGTKAQEAVSLNTTGLYSVCRNPLYLGNFFMMLSPVILSGNFLFILVFVLAFWLYYERIVSAEEAFLTQKFREEYLTLPIKLLALYHRLKTSKKQP